MIIVNFYRQCDFIEIFNEKKLIIIKKLYALVFLNEKWNIMIKFYELVISYHNVSSKNKYINNQPFIGLIL